MLGESLIAERVTRVTSKNVYCPAWIRTKIPRVRVWCPTIGRQGSACPAKAAARRMKLHTEIRGNFKRHAGLFWIFNPVALPSAFHYYGARMDSQHQKWMGEAL